MPDLVSLYERWGAAFAAEPEMSLDRWRAMVEEWPQLTAEPGGVDYVEVDAGGGACDLDRAQGCCGGPG